MEQIVNLIGTLGFPIAVAVAAFVVYWKFVSQQMDACARREEVLMAQSQQREEKLSSQLDKFTEALNNFNVSLTKIDARLQVIEKDINK